MTTRDGTSTVLLYPSGVFFDPMNPDPKKIHVEDIAWALSRIPRFGGHTVGEPYSVAQHSVLVSWTIEKLQALASEITPSARVDRILRRASGGESMSDDPSAPLWGLLHEVAEAVSGFGDVLAPVKRLPHVAEVVKPIERAIEGAAAIAWGFPADFASHPIVKTADRYVLDWEDRDLRDEGLPPHLGYAEPDPGRRTGAELHQGPALPAEKIVAWPWREALDRFLARRAELVGKRT